uniref:VWFA domain-containing protein n=1 Tax=Denticeps clupeoides TaxID=299321 RepID=A0AAY4DCH1_9TELE
MCVVSQSFFEICQRRLKMPDQQHLYNAILIGAISVSVSLAFNIDTENHLIYNGSTPEEDYFGYKVLQYKFENGSGIVVSAPLQRNKTGGTFKCSSESTVCKALDIKEEDSVQVMGMSMAVKPTSPVQFTICSPAWVHECDGTPYFNSLCHQLNDQLTVTSQFQSAFQECVKKSVDLVFLFDGSRSMETTHFNENKNFIKNIMKHFANASIQFAAVQFSTKFRTVFTFKDFQNRHAFDKLEKEPHMKALTNTYGAMQYVVENLFKNPTAGGVPDAIKVIVIITDGNPSDLKKPRLLKELDNDAVIRYIIAVGNEVKIENLMHIASDPKVNNTFYIENYNGLTGLLNNLQVKIFNIEGSKNAFGGNLLKEVSQSGFSAVYTKNTLVLGSVGSNSWRGSLYERKVNSKNETEIFDPHMEKDSYMGYSVAAGMKNGVSLYFSGAPRYSHKGQVVFFRKDAAWSVTQRLDSEQIGSYYGAEICVLDLDSDGETDFLLVGAPLFHQTQPRREGKIYVYALTAATQLVSQVNITAFTGRFGSSITSLRDLNGDSLRDVAVGAPLEDEQRGAIYIYLGQEKMGIQQKFSQHIQARKLSDNLQHFGVSIDGRMDMEQNGLTDIIVGGHGKAVLLRTRPVFSVSANINFEHPEINIDNFDCSNGDINLGKLTVCFQMTEKTNSSIDTATKAITITYELHLDSVRPKSRAFLSKTTEALRKTSSVLDLKVKETTCAKHDIYMPKCVTDTLSPVAIKLKFSQSGNQSSNLNGILDVENKNFATMELPFEKTCGSNGTCVSRLKLNFSFTSRALIVMEHEYLNVILTLSNTKDDSYNTTLTFYYHKGLSFSNLDVLQASRRILTNCQGDNNKPEETICSVSLPVFRSKTEVTFNSSFLVSRKAEIWDDTLSMTIAAHSDNGSPNTTSVSKAIPVKYAVDLAVKFLNAPHESTTYINYSHEDRGPKDIIHVFEIANMGYMSLPVNVNFTFPWILGNKFEVQNSNVSGLMIFYFSENRVAGQFSSLVQISYNETRYIQTGTGLGAQGPSTDFHWSQGTTKAEFIIPPNKALIVGTGGFGGLLLLILICVVLYKCGFFKRDRPHEMENEGEGDAVSNTENPEQQKDSGTATEPLINGDQQPDQQQG